MLPRPGNGKHDQQIDINTNAYIHARFAGFFDVLCIKLDFKQSLGIYVYGLFEIMNSIVFYLPAAGEPFGCV